MLRSCFPCIIPRHNKEAYNSKCNALLRLLVITTTMGENSLVNVIIVPRSTDSVHAKLYKHMWGSAYIKIMFNTVL